jgi:GNAT superfamily N-acetyltransferase
VRLAIRSARAEDLPAVLALIAQETIPEGRELVSDPVHPRYAAAFEAIDADPNHMLVVGEIDGEVLATLQLSFIPGLPFLGAWRGHIESVRIAGHLRNRGLGAELVGWAVEQCRARGCHMVQLMSSQSRVDSHRFYERLGWTKSHYGFKLKLGRPE